jgi:hypothetical protein
VVLEGRDLAGSVTIGDCPSTDGLVVLTATTVHRGGTM